MMRQNDTCWHVRQPIDSCTERHSSTRTSHSAKAATCSQSYPHLTNEWLTMDHDLNKPLQIYLRQMFGAYLTYRGTGKRIVLGYQTRGNACAPALPTNRPALTDRGRRPKRILLQLFLHECDAEGTNKSAGLKIHLHGRLHLSYSRNLDVLPRLIDVEPGAGIHWILGWPRCCKPTCCKLTICCLQRKRKSRHINKSHLTKRTPAVAPGLRRGKFSKFTKLRRRLAAQPFTLCYFGRGDPYRNNKTPALPV